MLVTRTETFTDWSYEGAHMGEQAATVGIGLMSGHIYFRYAYDFLQAGESVQRERSFIELSDGSIYELGTGESAEKITVIDHGLTSGGEVYLEVIGKPEIGVGVSRILRHVTIEYDDGKVPVLDTEQLEEVMTELSEHLTQSMVDTAEAVKQELRNELNTSVADVQVNMQNVLQERLTETKSEINGNVNEVREDLTETNTKVSEVSSALDGWVDSATESMNRLTARLDALVIPSIQDTQGFTPGQYTTQHGNTVNLLHALPNSWVNSWCVYRPQLKTVSLEGGHVSQSNRILRAILTTNLNIGADALGPLHISLRNDQDVVICQTTMFINRTKMPERLLNCQFILETLIPAGNSTHSAIQNGVRISGYNACGAQVIFESGATIRFELLTTKSGV